MKCLMRCAKRQRNVNLEQKVNITICSLKVNRYTFTGRSCVIFIFGSLLSKGQLLKVKNLLQQEQILYFKSSPFLKGFCHPLKKQKVTKFVALCENGRKRGR